jgi:hypothetical protein
MAGAFEAAGSLVVEVVAGTNITDLQASNFFAISKQVVYARAFLTAEDEYEEGSTPHGEVLCIATAPEGGATDPYWPSEDVAARTMRVPLKAGAKMLVIQLCNQGTIRDGTIGTLALPLSQDLVEALGTVLMLPMDTGGTLQICVAFAEGAEAEAEVAPALAAAEAHEAAEKAGGAKADDGGGDGEGEEDDAVAPLPTTPHAASPGVAAAAGGDGSATAAAAASPGYRHSIAVAMGEMGGWLAKSTEGWTAYEHSASSGSDSDDDGDGEGDGARAGGDGLRRQHHEHLTVPARGQGECTVRMRKGATLAFEFFLAKEGAVAGDVAAAGEGGEGAADVAAAVAGAVEGTGSAAGAGDRARARASSGGRRPHQNVVPLEDGGAVLNFRLLRRRVAAAGATELPESTEGGGGDDAALEWRRVALPGAAGGGGGNEGGGNASSSEPERGTASTTLVTAAIECGGTVAGQWGPDYSAAADGGGGGGTFDAVFAWDNGHSWFSDRHVALSAYVFGGGGGPPPSPTSSKEAARGRGVAATAYESLAQAKTRATWRAAKDAVVDQGAAADGEHGDAELAERQKNDAGIDPLILHEGELLKPSRVLGRQNARWVRLLSDRGAACGPAEDEGAEAAPAAGAAASNGQSDDHWVRLWMEWFKERPCGPDEDDTASLSPRTYPRPAFPFAKPNGRLLLYDSRAVAAAVAAKGGERAVRAFTVAGDWLAPIPDDDEQGVDAQVVASSAELVGDAAVVEVMLATCAADVCAEPGVTKQPLAYRGFSITRTAVFDAGAGAGDNDSDAPVLVPAGAAPPLGGPRTCDEALFLAASAAEVRFNASHCLLLPVCLSRPRLLARPLAPSPPLPRLLAPPPVLCSAGLCPPCCSVRSG